MQKYEEKNYTGNDIIFSCVDREAMHTLITIN